MRVLLHFVIKNSKLVWKLPWQAYLGASCGRYRNPGCESVDVFTVSWSKENNWLFPPPYLIPRVLKHMSAGGEDGTLIVSHWPSASWWPLLVDLNRSWKAFVTGAMTIHPYNGIFLAGSAASSIFTSEVPSFLMFALRICFTSCFGMFACDCQGQWLYQCYSVWRDCYFLLWWHIHCYFYLVLTTVDILGCLACWFVNVMV